MPDITSESGSFSSGLSDIEVEKMRGTPFTQRAWESTYPAFEYMTEEARKKLAQDPDWYARAKG